MKKAVRLITLCMAVTLAACTTPTAPKHTCTQVSVMKANGADGILWLPVQESMGEANIRILSDNQQLELIRVRLAKDSIDYFVPYELSRWGDRDLVIEFRTWLPDTVRRDRMVCWEAMHNSQCTMHNDQCTDSPYRSLYHQTPLFGWMNDPNGMFYDEQTGIWHLYYQYNPYGAMWGNMHWAHSTSRDLIHWERQPIAIRPTGLGTIFSGSSVIDRNNTAGFGENALVAIYTVDGESQKQALAYSLDGGQTFTHYAGNPILTDTIADFRDPKVFWDELSNRWVMTLACQQEIRFYASDNLKDWTYLSSFGEGYGCHDGVWECPDLVELKMKNEELKTEESKWVLLVNLNPGGPFGCLSGSAILRMIPEKVFFAISVCMIVLAMILMGAGTAQWVLYTGIALVGFGNSNIFSICFAQALNYDPAHKNEISGLMIMGLFGGTVFPLCMGFASDLMGTLGAVLVMSLGAAYLVGFCLKMKK